MTRGTVLCAALCAVGTLSSARLLAQAEPETTEIAGTVEGIEGKRARITIWHNDMQRQLAQPLADGQAAADGTFRFEAVPGIAGLDWGFNTLVLVARTADRVGLIELRGETAPRTGLVIPLRPSVTLRGSVHNTRGEPVAGASVWPSIFGEVTTTERPTAWVTSPLLPWRAMTDAEGRFELAGLPPITPTNVVVEHPRHARTQQQLTELGRPCKISVEIGGTIRGTVTMPDGSPAVRVPVVTTGRGSGYGRTISDEDGRFILSGLSADVYKVWAEAPDLTVIAALDLVVEPDGEVKGTKVRLVRGGFIIGRVVDADTGKPVEPGPYTDVAMYGPARGRGGSCECTPVLADGTFRIRAPAGDNRIYLRGLPGWSEPSEVVQVVEGRETEVLWRVRKAKAR